MLQSILSQQPLYNIWEEEEPMTDTSNRHNTSVAKKKKHVTNNNNKKLASRHFNPKPPSPESHEDTWFHWDQRDDDDDEEEYEYGRLVRQSMYEVADATYKHSLLLEKWKQCMDLRIQILMAHDCKTSQFMEQKYREAQKDYQITKKKFHHKSE